MVFFKFYENIKIKSNFQNVLLKHSNQIKHKLFVPL